MPPLKKNTANKAKKSYVATERDFMKAVNDARSAAGIRTRSAKAREWFRDNIIDIYSLNRPSHRTNVLYGNSKHNIGKAAVKLPGRLYMYFYDPKTKDKLPYYDIFPLVFILEVYDDGFLGLNLHYLPPDLRIILFEKLLKLTNNKKYDDTTRLKLSYKVITKFGRFKWAQPCIKRYLTDHIRSGIREVPPEFWEIAIFLPVEGFKKSIKEAVWNDSRKRIQNRKQRLY